MKHDPDFEKLVADILPRIDEVEIEEIESNLYSKKFLLIDVREKDEWEEGHLPEAIHLSKGVIERDIAKHAKKDQALVLYCGGGYRSALAADNLQKMGYKNIRSMKGGVRAWKEKNFSLNKK